MRAALFWMRPFWLLLLAASSVAAASRVADPVTWRAWSPQLFAQASAEKRFVLLDLGAVWCHWCHVMDHETYANPDVARLIGEHYVAARVDQDASPELAARYGDWGWPATIILAADGSELVKRRGYIAPQQMASLLQALVDDPTPGPSVLPEAPNGGDGGPLKPATRAALATTVDEAWDDENAGWGDGQKFLNAPTVEWMLARAAADDGIAATRARRTLNANLALIDPVAGGVFQYSATPDWHSPHYEKIMSYQADDLRLYALAYARFGDPAYLQAARDIQRYLRATLRAPDGSFYTSQDADLSAAVTGHDYYGLDAEGRKRLGSPGLDRHRYARENAWAIAALCALYDVTGDASALADARSAASWVLRERSLPGGGFRHDARGTHNAGGPYLADNLAMAQALLALYRSTGETTWLTRSIAALHFVDKTLRDPAAGYDDAPRHARAIGVFAKTTRDVDQNIALARSANLAAYYSNDGGLHAIAQHAARYFAAPAVAASGLFLPGLLLADDELAHEPVHITVVGATGDPRSVALRRAALIYPSVYARVESWDRARGRLPHADVDYPKLDRPAAFACSAGACSLPIFKPSELAPAVDRLARAQ
jgi:uncharacterized protein